MYYYDLEEKSARVMPEELFLLWRKGLMTQSFDSDNMDETVDHQGRNICEEYSPKFDRVNKQEIVENK